MTTKRLTSKSGITIPKDIRAQLGWQPGIAVDMETDGSGALLVRPHAKRCRFCGAVEGIRKYKDICVCMKCAAELKEAL